MTTLLQVKLQSPLGELEVLSTDRGLCALLFEDYRDTITARIDRRFAEHSILSGDPFGAAPALEAWLGGHLQALDTIPTTELPVAITFEISVIAAEKQRVLRVMDALSKTGYSLCYGKKNVVAHSRSLVA